MGLYLGGGALKSGILWYVNVLVCQYLYDCVSGKERGEGGGGEMRERERRESKSKCQESHVL